jgi:uncharacterized membrane protein
MDSLTAGQKKRINSIDLLRGIIMVVMAIDHVRDYFHVTALTDSPTNLATTTPQLFFTRWITHFCAPVFVMLAGTSAYLYGIKKTKSQLRAFLIKRGLWFILVEILVMSFVITFNPFYNVIIFQVIWATAISMILLGLVVALPLRLILIAGLIIVFGHNLLDYPEAGQQNHIGFLWDLAHHGFFVKYKIFPQHFLLMLYPFLPWTGVMFCGYSLGRLFEPSFDAAKRKSILITLGVSLTLLFVILRLINHYGDPRPWELQRNGLYSLLSFLNLTKYPPSLMYLGMTLGPSLFCLAFLEKVQNKAADFFIVYGRVPFFYYVIHFFLAHLICFIFFFIEGYKSTDIFQKDSVFLFRPASFGFSLWGVYAVWLFIVIILYPLCRKYGEYKRTHRQWWLSYL